MQVTKYKAVDFEHVSRRVTFVIQMHSYQSGIDGQLFVWIDQQKDVPDVSLEKGRKHNQLIIFTKATD